MLSSSAWASFRPMQCPPMKTALCSLFIVLLACCPALKSGSEVFSNLSSHSHQHSENHLLSNLMSREQVFQMLVSQANISDGRGAKSLGELAGALATLAQASSSTGSSNPDPSTVASVREMVQAFIVSLVQEHNESMLIVNDLSGFTHCDAAMNTSFANLTIATTTAGATTTGTTTTTSLCNSAACWEELKQLQYLNESCRTNLTWWYTNMRYGCDLFNGTNRSVEEVKNERCTENWGNGTYEQYLERDVQLLEELTYARENCSNLTEDYDREETVCQNITTQLVEKMRQCLECDMGNNFTSTTAGAALCPVVPDRQTICDDYGICWNNANSTFAARCALQQELAISRKAEYRALMRINCLLDVLVVNESQQYATLVGCINTTYSTDGLNIYCGTPPSPLACDPRVC
eukprot:TRINITY_DN89782_c0_g1_i1.p1 TRINITY_DN89782_c0_g1~~TRINITY_DN89782_c0_g1_i1.p1  ORF type:complete len:407 (+),score=61.33 TRINITY_DN89782_c0_g1_i1:36-1256(+)